jgi:DNA repair ATPase RecN
MSLLDDFARCSELSKRVMDGFRRWKTTAAALLAHRAELSEAKRLEDYLQYQLAEIKTAATHAGEDIELQAAKTLAHAEKISQLSSSAYDELYENDESIIAKLAYVRRRLEDLSEFDPDATGALDHLQATVLTLTDIAEACAAATKILYIHRRGWRI